MKRTIVKMSLLTLLLLGLAGCKKGEVSLEDASANMTESQVEAVSDSISYAATQEIEGKKFIKTASVNMEVKDVYDATIAIEKNLKELGGFVTTSQMNSQIISEETYDTSSTEAVLLRKFQMENQMQVRVPTEKLGVFLESIADKKLFLHSRIISAEDVAANIKYAELEGKRLDETEKEYANLKSNLKTVEKKSEIRSENNLHQLSSLELTDQLKYSTIDLYLKEPNISVATIAIANTKSIDNQYRTNFLFEMKNALVNGFFLIQKLIIGLTTIWPLLIIGILGFYFFIKRKTLSTK